MSEPRNALLSVFYKDGLEELARGLVEMGWGLISSGGTSKFLGSLDIPHRQVEEVTGFPEMMDGRVKTMHPKITGAILADRFKANHLEDAAQHDIELIDLVVCNLYPFSETVASGAGWADCVEKIDIGGPTMIRSAAKNHASVGVVVDPADYPQVLSELQAKGELSPDTLLKLGAKVFAHTAAYDLAVAEWMSAGEYKGLIGQRTMQFKYGENAQQAPAFYYKRQGDDPLSFHSFEQEDGTEPSYNNALEIADRQRQTISHIVAGFRRNFDETPLTAIVTKHGNCCGASAGNDPVTVLKNAIMGDRRAIHGGLVMTNFPINGELADLLRNWEIGDAPRRLLDAVSAPAVDDDALDLLRRKGKENKCRVFTNPALADLGEHSIDQSERWRFLPDGFAVQPNYTFVLDFGAPDFSWVYGPPDEQVLRDAVLGWGVGSTSNSNTMTLTRGGMLLANGTGQQDRVGAAELALKRAADSGHAGRADWRLLFRPDGGLPEFETVIGPDGPTGEQELRFSPPTGLPKLTYRFEGWDRAPRVVAYSDSFCPYPDAPEALLGAGIWTMVGTHGSVNDRDVEDAFLQVGLLGWQDDKLARGFAFH